MQNDLRTAIHVTSLVGLILSAAMLIPTALNFADNHPEWHLTLLAAAVTGLGWGLISVATRDARTEFSVRFGIVLVNMVWWCIPATSILPFMLGPAHLHFWDAVFESASGFTTTGSTVLVGLDQMDRGTLAWRSITQWLGGLGFVSVGLFVLPVLNVGGQQLFRLESSDRSDKVLPSFVMVLKGIILAYLGLSAACALAYYIAGMSGFDAVNHAMTTMATGGYSTHDASMGYFRNSAILWVGSFFMILASLPFTLYVGAMFFRRRPNPDPQIPVLIAIVCCATTVLLVARESVEPMSWFLFSEYVFDVISVISTTGFAAGDYMTWGAIAAPLFFILTFFGGCAGSTSGGLKTYRLILLGKIISRGMRQFVHPRGVFNLRYGDRRVDPVVLDSALVMSLAFGVVVAIGMLVLGLQGNDALTSLSGAVTALANVGPGLGDVIGPAGNFADVPTSTKITLSVFMIAGRLEIIVVMALFLPMLWR